MFLEVEHALWSHFLLSMSDFITHRGKGGQMLDLALRYVQNLECYHHSFPFDLIDSLWFNADLHLRNINNLNKTLGQNYPWQLFLYCQTTGSKPGQRFIRLHFVPSLRRMDYFAEMQLTDCVYLSSCVTLLNLVFSVILYEHDFRKELSSFSRHA